MARYGDDVAMTAAIPKALAISQARLVTAIGSSLSMRVISCENRLVIRPVSVVVKNLEGALIMVVKAAW